MRISLDNKTFLPEKSAPTSTRRSTQTPTENSNSKPNSESSTEISGSKEPEIASVADRPSEVHESSRPFSARELHQKSVDEQYNYLQEVVLEMSGDNEDAWKSGPNEVNLIGIRNLSDGKLSEPVGNTYDDTIYAVWVDDQGQRHVEAFNASTDAGIRHEGSRFGYRHEDGTMAYSHVADGFYQDAFAKSGIPAASSHNGNFNRGLAQVGDLYIHSDYNNDGVIQDRERLGEDRNGDGFGDGVKVGPGWGIYFHPGGMSKDGQVNSWSAGCQVIVGSQYQRFEEIINNASNQNFSYTLVDGRDLAGTEPLATSITASAPSLTHETFTNPRPRPNYTTGLPGFLGEDRHSQYGPGGPVLRGATPVSGGPGAGFTQAGGISGPSSVARPQSMGDGQPLSLEGYIQEICRYILNFDGPPELLNGKAQELISLCTLANLLQTPISEGAERLVERSLTKVFQGDQHSMAGAILSMVA